MSSIVGCTVESLESRTLMAASIGIDKSRLVFNDPIASGNSPTQSITLKNTGNATLTIAAGGISVTGSQASRFKLSSVPATPLNLAPGASAKFNVAFSASALGPTGATLQIKSNASNGTTKTVTLRGLGTKGEQGANEPSLQWILDTYQIPVKVGDSTPAEGTLDLPPKTPNDEVTRQFLQKAGSGNVTIEPIAIFSGAANPAAAVGWYYYNSASSITRKQLYTVPSADVQTVNPRVNGTVSFDPGSQPFGIYSQWAAQGGRVVYSEDFRNTFISPSSKRRMFRWYPLKNADGSTVANAYVVGNEEAFNNDLQDGVFIVRNVKLSTTTLPTSPPPPPPPPTGGTRYEAESARLIGAKVSTGQPGFTGSGFADFTNASGDSIRWTINNTTAGAKTLTFRYANGSTADRPLVLKVNGATIRTALSFPPTGSWSTWKTVSISTSLVAGSNTIELLTGGANGANIDSLTIA